MKKQFFISLAIFFLFLSFSTSQAQEKSKEMQPTSSSEKAVDFYQQSMRAAENAELDKSIDLLDKALEKDPDFFMAHFQRAFFALFFGNREQFEKHAENAITVDKDLNNAEQLLKDALINLKKDQTANLTDTGKKLVEMYPEDKNSYYILATFQNRNKDYKEAAKTYRKGLKVTDNPAPFYNLLGYTYLRDGQMKKAEKAFDKYIGLEPHHPNPYDSKGDYYMQSQEYEKAYDSYMKAHALNSEWSLDKAEKAKEMMNER